MNKITKVILKILLETVFFALVGLAGLIGSTLIFQNHIHPEYWETTWQDVVVVGAIVVLYIMYLYKVYKNFVKEKNVQI